jgi:diguanylate cyclase (GGDEF)-like protein/PAS domain S-box-containing protein
LKAQLHRLREALTGTLRRQLVLGIAAVHAVLMTIFIVDLVARQSSFLHEQATAQAQSLAKTLAANATSWVLAYDLAGLEEVVRSQSQYPGLSYAMILSVEGEVLSHTDASLTGRFASDTLSLELLQGAADIRTLIDTPSLVDVAVPVIANDALIAWARVGLSQEHNLSGLRVITRDGVLYMVLAIGVGILFAVLMARGLSSGLYQLIEITGRIRSGERALRADVSRHDELGQLAQNFNRMLDTLEQTEAQLATDQERFDLAMRGANDGLWDWDAKSNTVFYSERWKNMLGFSGDEIGDDEAEWSKRVHPDDLAEAEAAIQAHLVGETPLYQNEHRIRHRDGSWRWHLERGLAVRDGHGRVSRMVGTNTDITERKRAKEALFEEKERALVTLGSIGDGVITTDDAGIVTFMNQVAIDLTGWAADEAIGKPLEAVFRIVHEVTREPLENPVTFCISEGKVAELANHTLLINRVGVEIAIQDSAAPIRDRDGNIIGVVMVFHDVTEARDMAQRMNWQATHDSLTGLINRSEFERRLDDLLASAQIRHKQHALLYMDLDQFKIVNDTCGHVAGDELLKQLSFILDGQVRESDTLARLGGDEFGVLLAGCPMDRAEEIANGLRQSVKEFRFVWEDKSFELGISIGLVEINEHSHDLSSILSSADVACYAAKDLGRNRIHVYQPDDAELQQRHSEMQWVSRINEALADDRLQLYCQQIRPVAHDNADYCHVEILVRMLDADGKLVPPGLFIPAAERYNLMADIDRWVVSHTIAAIAGYQTACDGDTGLDTVAINLSGNSFSDENFLAFVRQQLLIHGVRPGLICFEITETAAITNLTRANHFIREMQKIGCRFALDDFGSGLSSFAYLKNLPVDYLKIDGSFVKDLVHDPIDRAMVRSINELGHVMGIKTIAEFVENDAILAHLKDIGVDYAQGYGIDMPVPLAERLHSAQARVANS